MKKLIKDYNNYYLKNDDKLIGTTDPHLLSSMDVMGLSLKNCQEIECCVDLDELALYAYKPETSINHSAMYKYLAIRFFKEGFQKALEILGDKKFSEEDLKKAILLSMKYNDNAVIQSLQQTEWDVEIVGSGNIYKTVLDCCPNYHPKFGCSKKDDCSCKNNELPKLDADGCLILKRK